MNDTPYITLSEVQKIVENSDVPIRIRLSTQEESSAKKVHSITIGDDVVIILYAVEYLATPTLLYGSEHWVAFKNNDHYVLVPKDEVVLDLSDAVEQFTKEIETQKGRAEIKIGDNFVKFLRAKESEYGYISLYVEGGSGIQLYVLPGDTKFYRTPSNLWVCDYSETVYRGHKDVTDNLKGMVLKHFYIYGHKYRFGGLIEHPKFTIISASDEDGTVYYYTTKETTLRIIQHRITEFLLDNVRKMNLD